METNLYLMPLAASLCLLTALVQAWILTAYRYLKLKVIKRIFPNYRDLIRSHVDYLIMSSIIFAMFLIVERLQINLPGMILWLIFIGALYNPFGFILQAIKPDIAEGGFFKKLGVSLGFLPTTIGLGYATVAVMLEAWGRVAA